MRKILMLAALLLVGCERKPDPKQAELDAYLAKVKADEALVVKAEAVVRSGLRDPDSAKFSGSMACRQPNAVAGFVNAKNGFGGYAGNSPYYYVNGDVVVGADDLEKFKRLGALCRTPSTSS